MQQMNSKPCFTLGLDARATERGFKEHFGRGTGRYATELIRALDAQPQEDLKLKSVGSADLALPAWQEAILSCSPFGKRTLRWQIFQPWRFNNVGVDFMHFFAHGDASPFLKVPYFVTVLDLIPLKFPDLYKAHKPSWRFHLARYLENESLKRASGIFAISQATARDVAEIMGYPREKIVVTPLAVSEGFSPLQGTTEERRTQQQKLKQSIGLAAEQPVLLYVGGIDPRKNILFLIDVFAEVLKVTSGNVKPKLLLVGRYDKDDQYPRLKAKISALGLENDVQCVGFVPDEMLCSYYQLADLFVFPSLYEGFGLPVLEAFACGKHVVAGNNSCMPEVMGSAGTLVADGDKLQWAKAIIELLARESSKQVFSERCVEQARLFNWSHTAAETLRGYRQFCYGK